MHLTFTVRILTVAIVPARHHLCITLVFPTPASPTTRILITGADVSAAADMGERPLLLTSKKECFVLLISILRFATKLTRIVRAGNFLAPESGVRKAGPCLTRLVVNAMWDKGLNLCCHSVHMHDDGDDAPALSLRELVAGLSLRERSSENGGRCSCDLVIS